MKKCGDIIFTPRNIPEIDQINFWNVTNSGSVTMVTNPDNSRSRLLRYYWPGRCVSREAKALNSHIIGPVETSILVKSMEIKRTVSKRENKWFRSEPSVLRASKANVRFSQWWLLLPFFTRVFLTSCYDPGLVESVSCCRFGEKVHIFWLNLWNTEAFNCQSLEINSGALRIRKVVTVKQKCHLWHFCF